MGLAAMTFEQALEQIGDGGEWAESDGTWTLEGDHADGAPTVEIDKINGGYVIAYTLGWYEQRGDADSPQDAADLFAAMEAASRALEITLFTLRNARRAEDANG